MRSTNSPQVFVDRLLKTAQNLGDVPKVAVGAAALVVKTSVAAEINRIAPGGRLSGVGKHGGKVGVKYIPGTSTSSGKATALVVATGQLHLLERDTAEHDIYPRGAAQSPRGSSGRARSTRGLGTQHKALAGVAGGSHGFGPVAHAHSRGTRGQHPFERGVDAAKPLIEGVLKRATVAALAKELG